MRWQDRVCNKVLATSIGGKNVRHQPGDKAQKMEIPGTSIANVCLFFEGKGLVPLKNFSLITRLYHDR